MKPKIHPSGLGLSGHRQEPKWGFAGAKKGSKEKGANVIHGLNYAVSTAVHRGFSRHYRTRRARRLEGPVTRATNTLNYLDITVFGRKVWLQLHRAGFAGLSPTCVLIMSRSPDLAKIEGVPNI
jgi:hypothetical protein